MQKLTGYGSIIRCSQPVPYDADPYYFEGCFRARHNKLFQLPLPYNGPAVISTIMHSDPACQYCNHNAGLVEVFWHNGTGVCV